MITIIPFEQTERLTEAGQWIKNKYSYLVTNPKNENELIELSPPSKCRDYLNDVYAGLSLKLKPEKVYGFTFIHDKYPDLSFDKNQFWLKVEFEDKEQFKLYQNNYNKFLKTLFEDKYKIEIQNYDEKTILVKLPIDLMGNVFTHGLISFLIRLMCYDYKSDNFLKEISTSKDLHPKYPKQYNYISPDGNLILGITIPIINFLINNLNTLSELSRKLKNIYLYSNHKDINRIPIAHNFNFYSIFNKSSISFCIPEVKALIR